MASWQFTGQNTTIAGIAMLIAVVVLIYYLRPIVVLALRLVGIGIFCYVAYRGLQAKPFDITSLAIHFAIGLLGYSVCEAAARKVKDDSFSRSSQASGGGGGGDQNVLKYGMCVSCTGTGKVRCMCTYGRMGGTGPLLKCVFCDNNSKVACKDCGGTGKIAHYKRR